MGERSSPVPAQIGSGIPAKIKEYLYLLPFNDFEMAEETVKNHHEEIAAMMIEPCLGNISGLEPVEGYLAHLRKLCDDHGIVLIFDEVKTGFRLANGGAREAYGVIPDISTYAKSLGNGYPVAAFGGKKEIMDRIGGGEIAHAGTFGANGSSMAAAKAVLEILKSSPVLDDMGKRGEVLKSGMDKVLTDAGIPHQMTGHPNMQGFLITETPANEVRDLANHDDNFYNAIMAHLYENGVWAEMDAREPWFISESHTDELIRETLNKFEDAVIAAKN